MGSSPIVGSEEALLRLLTRSLRKALRSKQPVHLQNLYEGQCPERQRGRTVNPLAERLRRFESYLAHYYAQVDAVATATAASVGVPSYPSSLPT